MFLPHGSTKTCLEVNVVVEFIPSLVIGLLSSILNRTLFSILLLPSFHIPLHALGNRSSPASFTLSRMLLTPSANICPQATAPASLLQHHQPGDAHCPAVLSFTDATPMDSSPSTHSLSWRPLQVQSCWCLGWGSDPEVHALCYRFQGTIESFKMHKWTTKVVVGKNTFSVASRRVCRRGASTNAEGCVEKIEEDYDLCPDVAHNLYWQAELEQIKSFLLFSEISWTLSLSNRGSLNHITEKNESNTSVS